MGGAILSSLEKKNYHLMLSDATWCNKQVYNCGNLSLKKMFFRCFFFLHIQQIFVIYLLPYLGVGTRHVVTWGSPHNFFFQKFFNKRSCIFGIKIQGKKIEISHYFVSRTIENGKIFQRDLPQASKTPTLMCPKLVSRVTGLVGPWPCYHPPPLQFSSVCIKHSIFSLPVSYLMYGDIVTSCYSKVL